MIDYQNYLHCPIFCKYLLVNGKFTLAYCTVTLQYRPNEPALHGVLKLMGQTAVDQYGNVATVAAVQIQSCNASNSYYYFCCHF